MVTKELIAGQGEREKRNRTSEIPVFVSINTSSMPFKLINMLKGARGSLLLCHIFL